MSISLQKGQKVSLTKDNNSLNKIIIGLGWDELKQKKSFSLFSQKQQNIDCDASAFVLTNGKLTKNEDMVYFGNLKHYTNSVEHMGDNLTGAGEGDDEQIIVELTKVPQSYDRIVIVVNIYDAVGRKQHFGMLENAFIRIVDAKTNTELCKYVLNENYNNMTAMIFGEVYRQDEQWKFSAIGQATSDPDLRQLVNRFL